MPSIASGPLINQGIIQQVFYRICGLHCAAAKHIFRNHLSGMAYHHRRQLPVRRLVRDQVDFGVEKANLVPADNRLTVVPGLLGAYPNAIYRVNERDLPAFEAAIRGLASEADYRALADRFAIRRTSPGFWAASDALHEAWRKATPLEAGLLDYNRLENR